MHSMNFRKPCILFKNDLYSTVIKFKNLTQDIQRNFRHSLCSEIYLNKIFQVTSLYDMHLDYSIRFPDNIILKIIYRS